MNRMQSNQVASTTTEAFSPKSVGWDFSPRKSWSEYDLKTENVWFNGQPTKFQGITYKGNFVNFMTKHYYVFPHEDVIKVINPIVAEISAAASNIKAVAVDPNQAKLPHEKTTKTLKTPTVFGRPSKEIMEQNNIVTNNLMSIMRADYHFEDKIDITGAGDYIKYGFSIENSIEGGVSFSVCPFTVRSVCDNRMYHIAAQARGLSTERLRTVEVEKTAALVEQAQKIIKARAELMEIGKERIAHVKDFKEAIPWITEKILAIGEQKNKLVTRYKEMTKLKLLQAQAELLVERMPTKLMEKLDYISVVENTGKDKKENPYSVVVKNPPTQWKVFNDITEDLTYSKRTFFMTMKHYGNLDRILVKQSAKTLAAPLVK